ncbi:MAG: dehalogenase [Dehalogenimonas sp.]|jgi:CDP-diglyceride synthetase|uniref:Dehalogenase n=1 Tax=Candidatus Dehalogenimonas loeffleri TaxID=3127115 RepID=A0ABZ2J4G9_9CHLR|nr:dehalogenase [Dehalogenimonas sp.]
MELTPLWILIAILLTVGFIQLLNWLKRNDRKPAWWVWFVGAVGLLLVLMAVQHYLGTLEEMYFTAAWMGALILGIPGVLLLVVSGWRMAAGKSS